MGRSGSAETVVRRSSASTRITPTQSAFEWAHSTTTLGSDRPCGSSWPTPHHGSRSPMMDCLAIPRVATTPDRRCSRPARATAPSLPATVRGRWQRMLTSSAPSASTQRTTGHVRFAATPSASATPAARSDFAGGSNADEMDCRVGCAHRRARPGRGRHVHPGNRRHCRRDAVLPWRLSSGANGRAARCVGSSRRAWPLGQTESDEIVRAENAGVGGAALSSDMGSRARAGRLGCRSRRLGVAPAPGGLRSMRLHHTLTAVPVAPAPKRWRSSR